MKVTRTNLASCAWCGYEMDALSHMSGGGPRVGDITMCIECHRLLRIATVEPFSYTQLTDEDAEAMLEREQYLDLMSARAAFEKYEKKKKRAN